MGEAGVDMGVPALRGGCTFPAGVIISRFLQLPLDVDLRNGHAAHDGAAKRSLRGLRGQVLSIVIERDGHARLVLMLSLLEVVKIGVIVRGA